MSNNITINIKNCCGGGSGASSGGDGTYDDFIDGTLADPASASGPPEGYSEPDGTIADRQCKMAVWLYDWLEWWLDYLATTELGSWILAGVDTMAKSVVIGWVAKSTVARYLASAVVALITALGGTPGIDPSDPLVSTLAWVLTSALLVVIQKGTLTEAVTVPMVTSALAEIQTKRDQIICALAKAQNAEQALENLEKVLDELELGSTQEGLIEVFTPPVLINMLFYTADWWPSFDDDYLSGITETCCGGYVDGTPMLPQSTASCAAANYVLDQLIVTLNAVDACADGYWSTWYEFSHSYENVLAHVQANLSIPDKVHETAYSYNTFETYVAKYITDKMSNLLSPFINPNEYADLAEYLTLVANGLICGLYNAEDTEAAYTILSDVIDLWATENAIDETLAGHIKTSIDGLVHSDGDFIGLLFTQDSDLLGYSGSDDCSGCGGGGDCDDVKINWGSFLGGSTWQGQHTSYGYYQLSIWFNTNNQADIGNHCGPLEDVSLSNPSGVTKESGYPIYRLYNEYPTAPDSLEYSGDTLPTGSYCLRGVIMVSHTQFTIDVNQGGDCS